MTTATGKRGSSTSQVLPEPHDSLAGCRPDRPRARLFIAKDTRSAFLQGGARDIIRTSLDMIPVWFRLVRVMFRMQRMCLAVPVRVVCVDGDAGKVDVSGNMVAADFSLVEGVRPGDYVILHAGFAIQRYDPAEAEETLRLLREAMEAGA